MDGQNAYYVIAVQLVIASVLAVIDDIVSYTWARVFSGSTFHEL